MRGRTLPPERWARIQELFLEALDVDVHEREAFIAAACGEDEDMADEVRSLLAADEDGVIPRLPSRPSLPSPAPPSLQRIGEYRLLRSLGEGGMGTVYLAEREGADFTQTVALKLIRAGFVDRELETRLRSERRILARLEHPGIARLVDGGATPTGQPFVAMEYVDGVPITTWCRERRLDAHERVRLFLGVCDAVHYAHQQLVVHRDLKPGNIMVTTGGRAKLLDFGIAKALDEGRGDQAAATAAWITPAYASPEQLRGEAATTLTDVYALGVVLYELLAERRPFTMDGLSLAEVRRLVCEQDPPPPGVHPDLDLIVLKALARESGRRYGSPAQLADDLRRWLDGMPVQARPDTLAYRTRSFVRRHRAGVAAGAVALLALVAGFATTLWQARVAARERDRATEALVRSQSALRQSDDVTAFLLDLFDASSPEQAFGDTLAARALLRRGIAQVELLDAQPVVQASLLDAIGRVYERLAQYPLARSFLERALDQRRRHLGPDHADVAATLNNLAIVLRREGRQRETDSLHRLALEIQRRSLPPDDPRIAETLALIGYVAVALADLAGADTLYREAYERHRQSLGETDVTTTQTLTSVASVASRMGRHSEAESLYRRVIDLRELGLGTDHHLVATSRIRLADEIAFRRPAEAESLLRAAVALQRRVLRPDDLGRIHGLSSLANLLERRGLARDAEALYREALDVHERVLGLEHPSTAWAVSFLAQAVGLQGRFAESDALFARSLAVQRRMLGPRHQATSGTLMSMARVEVRRGRLDRAEALQREALALRRGGLVPGHPLIITSLTAVAEVQLRRGDRAGALAGYDEAIGLAAGLHGQDHARTDRLQERRAAIAGGAAPLDDVP